MSQRLAGRRCWRRPIVLLTTAALVAILPVVVAPAAQADDSSCTSANPPSLLQNSYLVPAWSDSAGWKNPNQYETIVSGDVDGVKSDELIVRMPSGLSIYKWDTAKKTWAAPITTTVFSDSDGFGQSHPDTYRTITTGNIDGRPGAEILGRGPDGIQTWTLNAGGDGLTRIDAASTLFNNADFWNQEDNYSTIRVANVYGDSRDEVLGRGTDGMEVWSLDPATTTWTQVGLSLLDWGDGAGWSSPELYKTISVGDVDGDGQAEVVGRTPGGVDARALVPGGDGKPTWHQLAPPGAFTDGAGFGVPAAYETFQLADVVVDPGEPHPKSEVIARNVNGLYHATLENGAWILDQVGISQFSDANGWGSFTPPAPSDRPVPADFRYSTIHPVTVEVGQPQLIIGRDATGIRTLAVNDLAHNSVSAPYPDYTDLTGIPNGLNTPPAELPKTPEGRAYWYINAKAHRAFWPGAQDDATILQQYRATTEQSNLTSLNSILAGGGFDPGQDQALNVPRATYNKVNQDVNDWTTAVTTLYEHLLGAQGTKQLVEQTFVTDAGQVDVIKAAFGGNPALVALLGDLLWGVIGLLGVLDFGLSDLGEAIVAGGASLLGSGVAAGVGFVNPDGAINTQADMLKDQMVNSFCGASAFIDQSFDQAVQDYGLLTSSARLAERTPSSAPLFDQAKRVMVRAQQLWIWQQFGNAGSTFSAAWCDFEHGSDCSWSNHDPNTWNAPENPNISYRLVGSHCDDPILGNDTYAKLLNLNPSFGAMMSPRQTDTVYNSGDENSGKGKPLENSSDGIQGWNLGTAKCDDF